MCCEIFEKKWERKLAIAVNDNPSIPLAFFSEDTDGTLSTSFQGRPLKGKRVDLPSDYACHVITCKETENGEVESVEVNRKTQSMTVWNLSTVPTRFDAVQEALQAIPVLSALHDCSHEWHFACIWAEFEFWMLFFSRRPFVHLCLNKYFAILFSSCSSHFSCTVL